VDRRDFVKSAAALGTAAAIPHRGGAATDQPNVILITADDLGWNELSCYGNPDLDTPNIDRMADEGVRFTNAFVTAPSCSASRSSIITGQAPHSVGVLGLTHRHTRYQMPHTHPTIAGELRDRGYGTAIQGKWHVATYKNTRKYGYNQRLSIISIEHAWKAKSYISAHKNRPFYLELNFIQPHRPEGDHYFRMVKDHPVDPDSISIPEYWRIPDWPEIREDVAAYYSQIMEMDAIIGEIMQHLEDVGIADNTLVMFVSDNGPPYPGCKITCYDRGIGTPMILKWPGRIPEGKVIDSLASTVDLMPTALEATGTPVPSVVQGRSLLPLCTGEADSVRDEIFAEVTYHVTYVPTRVIRTDRYKYIENLSPDPTGLDQSVNMEWAQKVAMLPGQRCCVLRPERELYDLETDPHEENNLVDKSSHAAVRKDLSARLARWRKETNDPFPDLS